MSFHGRSSTLLKNAERAFHAATTVPQIKRARELAKAAWDYARSARASRETRLCAACLTIRAEHALGVALRNTQLAKAAPGNQYTSKETADENNGLVYLRDLGITGPQSSLAKKLAVLTNEELESWLAEQCAADIEPTFAAARRYAEEVATTKSDAPVRNKKPPRSFR